MPITYQMLGDDALVFEVGGFWVLMLQLTATQYAVSFRLVHTELKSWVIEANTVREAVDKAAEQAMDMANNYQLDVL